MAFDTDFARQFAERFRDGTPDEKYKQKPVVSRREIVAGLYDDIMAQRSAGYSFEGIAAYFGSLGAPIKVSTLKSYLLRSGERRSADQKAGAGQTRKRAGATTNGTPRPQRASVRRDGGPSRPPRTDSDTTSATSIAQPMPAAVDTTTEAHPAAALGRAAESTVSAASTRSEQAPAAAEHVSALVDANDAGTAAAAAPPAASELSAAEASARGTNASANAALLTTPETEEELAAGDGPALPISTAPSAPPSSSRVEPTTTSGGSGEENLRLPSKTLLRPDAPSAAPARPERLSRLLEGRASSPERPKNAFAPRLDREL